MLNIRQKLLRLLIILEQTPHSRCSLQRGGNADPFERGPKAAAVLRRRLRVSLLAAAERRWSRSRRRRSVLPPQAARSPGQWRPERQRHGQQRRERFSLAGAAFPPDFCEGTLPYSYNLCVAAPARAAAEAAWPPPPLPILPAEELLAGEPCDKPNPSSSSAVAGEPPTVTDAPQRLRYAIPEELPTGSLVGPLARDLGLSPDELPARKLRVASAGKKQLKYFTVNEENGNLYVSERLDREELCGESASCSVSFEALVHNPLNVFHVQVDIQDVNDNSPSFSKAALELEIGEWTVPGSRFPLEMAHDEDVGSNSLLTYQLSSNPSFSLALKESEGESKQPELVLEKTLDREKQSSFELLLTAVDGGEPMRTGTVQVRVNVTDANDNPPVFSQDRYRTSLREDAPPGSEVLKVSASDADAGTNARITYHFGKMPVKVLEKFVVDRESGTITLQEPVDFEDTRAFSLAVEARDGGGLVAHCKVEVEVLDVNDNTPEITILSLSSPVPEDASVGTVVALLNVNDPDSGENGEVSCELSGEAPLSIVASSGGSYKVVTASALDREQASEHRVTVVARDRGRPALWIHEICPWAKHSRESSAALGACSAGRRLRAPLLTERSERKVGALQPRPLRTGSIVLSLAVSAAERFANVPPVRSRAPAVRRGGRQRPRAVSRCENRSR
ncbi:protocadherin gamma-B5-like, partial [Empidonax traillii]|uniref:protocadherin gamma-B5-like n=1 Tax=Empidonax traillii TaxID=164674 RepID=UPI000FFD6CB1